MYYQNYDDYIRNILGYSPDTNFSDTYYAVSGDKEDEENLDLYPEIYKLVYPMVSKACEENRGSQITNDIVEDLTNSVYTNIEVEDKDDMPKQPELRNGDVPNPRVKQPEQIQTRHMGCKNPLLRDLIKILVIRELFAKRKPIRPHYPPFYEKPGMRPPPLMPR